MKKERAQSYNDDTSYEVSLLLKSGDVAAFDLVFKQFYSPLYIFASRFVFEHECEDIVQETMVWLWENKDSLQADKSLKSLLFTIVKNKCLNRVSHKQVRQDVHQKLFLKSAAIFEDPDFYMHQDLVDILDNAIRSLPKDYREAFEMNRYQDMTYREIAEAVGMSYKTVAYRISQALLILRVELKDYLPVFVLILGIEL